MVDLPYTHILAGLDEDQARAKKKKTVEIEYDDTAKLIAITIDIDEGDRFLTYCFPVDTFQDTLAEAIRLNELGQEG